MSMIWRSKLALSLCLLALGSGCGDDPKPIEGNKGDGDGDRGDGDEGDGDKGDGDKGDGDGDVGDGDGDGTPDPTVELGMVEGQFWMRTDLKAKVTQPQANAVINSDLTAYSVVKITKDGDNFKMVDWQCHVSTVQTCSAPCTMASSETSEGQAYAPSVRAITVSGSQWEASACAAAVGWKWDFSKGDKALPSSASDPLIYNPGEGGPGVDIKVNVSAKLLGVDVPYACTASTVQKVDVLYSGTLSGGKLQSTGVVKDNGSDQFVFDSPGCGDVPDPEPVGTGTLRLLRKDIPGGSGEPSTWTCPSLSDFQKALPKK